MSGTLITRCWAKRWSGAHSASSPIAWADGTGAKDAAPRTPAAVASPPMRWRKPWRSVVVPDDSSTWAGGRVCGRGVSEWIDHGFSGGGAAAMFETYLSRPSSSMRPRTGLLLVGERGRPACHCNPRHTRGVARDGDLLEPFSCGPCALVLPLPSSWPCLRLVGEPIVV